MGVDRADLQGIVKIRWRESDILDLGSRVHGFILVMEQLMLFLFFLELDQFLLEDILEVLYQLLVIFLDLRDLYLSALKHIIFDLVAIASHSYL